MTRLRFDRVYKYHINAKTISPLHIGSSMGEKDEILKDSVTGNPFVQASGIAGMLRNVSDSINGKDVTEALFGSSKAGAEDSDTRSRTKVSDGYFDNSTVILELRPGVSIYRKTGTASKENGAGQKFDTTYIAAGAELQFDLYLYDEGENSKLREGFERVLGILKSSEARLGSKKSSGAGKFVAESIKRVAFDLTSEEGRKRWQNEDSEGTDYTDITSEIDANMSDIKYIINVFSETEGPILVKGISMAKFGEGAADCENLRSGKGDYIVPGTSFRGTIKSQMVKIAGYLNKESVIGASFGLVATSHGDSKCGNLIFNDAVIGDTQANIDSPIRSRIHIDKLTGGVMSQALFSEQNASGALNLSIEILDRNDPDATLGLLLYALRDLANNAYNLGSGYATGKGFVKVSKIVVSDGNNEAQLLFKDDESVIEGNKKIIDDALGKLREVQG